MRRVCGSRRGCEWNSDEHSRMEDEIKCVVLSEFTSGTKHSRVGLMYLTSRDLPRDLLSS
jgi:hypothetical protein